MALTLTEEEVRVLGCLLEKSIVTPEQYPLTLNALTNACNQKSSRDPVLQLEQGTVQRTVRLLEAKHLVRTEENFKSRTEKYLQRFCNTPFSDFKFDSAELALVILLLLRGPQTPGELRSRSGRLHDFADNHEVVTALNSLMTREAGALVASLPRQAGRKDAQYVQLFSGDVAGASSRPAEPAPAPADSNTDGSPRASLEQRVSALEHELAALKASLGESD